MPFLVILKRFEVWLLLAIVIALVVYAFQPPPPLPGTAPANPALAETLPEIDPAVIAANPATEIPEASPALVIREVKMIPSSPGFIVETLIAGGPGRDEDLPLTEDRVRATTAEGQPVNRFFEPFQTPPVLLASGDSTASLRWWLPAPTDSLWIEIDNERIQADLP